MSSIRAWRLSYFLVLVLLASCRKAGVQAEPGTNSTGFSFELNHPDSTVQQGLEMLLKAVKSNRTDGVAWDRLGVALRMYGQLEAARAALSEAEKLDPTNPRWPYFLGLIAVHQGSGDAEVCLQRAVARSGHMHPGGRLELARWLSEQGRWADAEATLKVFDDSPGTPPQALLMLAQAAAARGDFRAAVERAQSAVRSADVARPTLALLAVWHRRNGDETAANEAARKLASAPGSDRIPEDYVAEFASLRVDARALSERVHPMLASGRTNDAMQIVLRMKTNFPDYPDSWLASGRLRILMKEFPAAAMDLEKHVSMDPDSIQGWFQLGSARMQMGRLDDSEAAFRKTLDLKPNFGPAWFNLAVVMGRRGDFTNAEIALLKTRQFNPEHPDTPLLLSDLHLRRGNTGAAEMEWRIATQLSPQDPRLRSLGSRIEKSRGKLGAKGDEPVK